MDCWRPIAGWVRSLDLIFPRACTLCERILDDPSERALCRECWQSMPPIEDACIRCGAPHVSKDTSIPKNRRRKKPGAGDCPYCRNRPWAMGRVFAFTTYSGTALRIARYIKEARCEPLACQIGIAMAEWLVRHQPFSMAHYDIVVPIPQHWYRRLTHRYNQAEVLARQLAQQLDGNLALRYLNRSRWTQKQGMKTISERRINVLGAFSVPSPRRRSIAGKRVLLVDDIMTSGATMNEAARAFREGGACHVDGVIFARGVGVRGGAALSVPGPANA